MTNPSSLPDNVIDRVFAVLRYTYGRQFDQKWECPAGENPADFASGLKAHWARELSCFSRASLGHALKNLPRYGPPSLVEFRHMCLNTPAPETLRLPEPPADPVVVAKVVEGLRKVKSRISANPGDPLAWAKELKARDEAGEKLSQYQREGYKKALTRAEAPEQAPVVFSVNLPRPLQRNNVAALAAELASFTAEDGEA